jgi:hypothetical protein
MSTLTIHGYPVQVSRFPLTDLQEVMYYLYLPVIMEGTAGLYDLRVPDNVQCCLGMIQSAIEDSKDLGRIYRYVYLSARKGWATADNPLNRPGWHCDGFGTDDLNYVWWKGEGTRFTNQRLEGISTDHNESLKQFDAMIDYRGVYTPPQGHLYRLEPDVVHATPIIEKPGWRQFVKVSLSNHKYNLENNSHNYLFDYDWPLEARADTRNDTDKAQRDYS